MTAPTLREEWQSLLVRRPAFRSALAPYEQILTVWEVDQAERVTPLAWSGDACRECWRRGTPLLAEAPPAIGVETMEETLGPLLEIVGGVGAEEAAIARLVEAWDRGEVSPSAFFPSPGRIGSPSLQERTGLSQECLAFLAYGSLRPLLHRYFADCHPYLTSRSWALGVCPFCGAPPGFADLAEDGQRRLACHLCGAGWNFPRLQCPYCGTQKATDLVRFLAEDAEEGYAISACTSCLAYLKELDRRVRWNGASALVEDWGSPHLDVVAERSGYWRAVPTLVQVGKPD